MANIQERRDKTGKLTSYSIRVHRGRNIDGKQLKPFTATFEVLPTWTEKSARKKAEAFAATFEKDCKMGVISDSRRRFEDYCKYVIDLKEERGQKHRTVSGYRELAMRIYPQIGHIKLTELRADHLNDLYTYLSKDGMNRLTGGKLSAKTISAYHRLVNLVLQQAFKEGLIPVNVARRVTPPKVQQKDVAYFQPEQMEAICEALEAEPIKWKTLVHLMMITGARRGEVLGLRWENVKFEERKLYICNSILYSKVRGIYEDTPKTEKSKRFISIPAETVQMLQEYKQWQTAERLKLGAYYKNQNLLFTQDNGEPMHPDSATRWLAKFSKRHNLPHITPHAFRHTMASILFYNHVDAVSVSKRLGHAQVSTTANIYAHAMEEADKQSAEILSDIILKTGSKK